MKNIILMLILFAGIMSAQTSDIPNIVNNSNSAGTGQQKQEQPQNMSQKQLLGNLSIILIDMDSKKPVPAARITLAPKKEKYQKDEGIDEDECMIDTSLTGLSDERGEVHIQNVKSGEYVVIQMLPKKTTSELNEKVVTWGRTPTDPKFHLSLGAAIASHGNMTIVDGALVIANAYMEADGLGFRTTATGRLLTVSVPSSGRAPIRIEIPNPAKTTNDTYSAAQPSTPTVSDTSSPAVKPISNPPSKEPAAAENLDKNRAVERWPHRGSVSLALTWQFSNNMTGVQKFINAEDAFLKSLNLSQITRNNSGQIISSTPITDYDYSPDIFMGGIKVEYFLGNSTSLGLHFYFCSYDQSLSVTIGSTKNTGSGSIISTYVLGPSLTQYLYHINRFGLSLHGDLGFVFGEASSLPALDSLRKLGALNDVSGLPNLVQSKHIVANISGIQGNIALCANWFIVRWFSLDAGLSCYFFYAGLSKEIWPNTGTTISTIVPAFYLGTNFCLFNRASR